MAEVKYQNAESVSGKIVDINAISKENKESDYRCLGCGNQMVPVIQQKHKDWKSYFRHKNTCESCHPNRYLHTLAERKLKERFYNKDIPFKVEIPVVLSCARECDLKNVLHCRKEGGFTEIDLYDWYDTCDLERRQEAVVAGGTQYFVADLKLTHSEHPEREPILIEICVTHENSKEKREKAGRIIELFVPNKAEEGEKTIHFFCKQIVFRNSDVPKVRLDGFKSTIQEEEMSLHKAVRVKCFNSGKPFFEEISCSDIHTASERKDLLHEFNLVPKQDMQDMVRQSWNIAKFHLESLGIKAPRVCMNCDFTSSKGCQKLVPNWVGFMSQGKIADHCNYYRISAQKKHALAEELSKLWRIVRVDNTKPYPQSVLQTKVSPQTMELEFQKRVKELTLIKKQHEEELKKELERERLEQEEREREQQQILEEQRIARQQKIAKALSWEEENERRIKEAYSKLTTTPYPHKIAKNCANAKEPICPKYNMICFPKDCLECKHFKKKDQQMSLEFD